MERAAWYRERVPLLLKRVWVFAYVCFAWIFFRAASLSDALLVVRRIFTGVWSSPAIPALMVLLACLVWLYESLYESRVRPVLAHGLVRVCLAAAMILYLCLFSAGGGAFIYFQF